MPEEFERIIIFHDKIKVELIGELQANEIVCPSLEASKSLLILLTESGYKKQVYEAVLLSLSGRYFCYQNEIFESSEGMSSYEFKEAMKKGIVRVVGAIHDRELFFNIMPPLDTYFSPLDYSDIKALLPENMFSLQIEMPVFIGIRRRSMRLIEPTNKPCFCYRNKIVALEGVKYRLVSPLTVLPDDDVLLVKHYILKKEHAFEKVKKQVEAFESFEKALKSKRETIPEDVKMFVWRRDEGKCVLCGSQRSLEFDHIIPLSKGGSNTERNIQLLCEMCNRQKSNNI
jgi:hypothetical protein